MDNRSTTPPTTICKHNTSNCKCAWAPKKSRKNCEQNPGIFPNTERLQTSHPSEQKTCLGAPEKR